MKVVEEKHDIPVIIDGSGHSCFELNEDAQRYFLTMKEKSTVLSEDESTKNGSPAVYDKGDGSFVIMGTFDL